MADSHISITEMMESFSDHVAEELKCTPDVIDTDPPIDSSDLYHVARKWRKYKKASVVFADLAGSTTLRTGRWEASTASIYEASIYPAAKILSDFGANFIDVQGDAAFGLFVGDHSKSRALCAGITIKTFGEKVLMPALAKKWPSNTPQTGFKVGCAVSSLLAKKIGIPRTDHHAPVWAGRAVNYAAKCSQQAQAHEMIVTKPVADSVRTNEYLWFSCACGDSPEPLWKDVEIEKVSGADSAGLILTSAWCENCGDSYAEKICSGSWSRSDIESKRSAFTQKRFQEVIKAREAQGMQTRKWFNG